VLSERHFPIYHDRAAARTTLRACHPSPPGPARPWHIPGTPNLTPAQCRHGAVLAQWSVFLYSTGEYTIFVLLQKVGAGESP
jgi:hypothetical protein